MEHCRTEERVKTDELKTSIQSGEQTESTDRNAQAGLIYGNTVILSCMIKSAVIMIEQNKKYMTQRGIII